MPDGPCGASNDGELSQFNGQVRVLYRYGWDGVSTRDVEPGCVGPLIRIQVSNTSTTRTFYAHFRGRRGKPKVITMAPGFQQTLNAQQLHNAGFDDNTDLEDLQITSSPNPPAKR